jgi:multidrug resistance efflux pump
MTHDESVALRWVSEGATAEIERLREESRWAEQMLQYLRSEIVEARGDSSRYQAIGRKAESEVKAEQQARAAVEARLGDIRRAQKEEFQSELKQQKQQSDAELAKRDERVRALEVEVEEMSWSSAWDRAAWAAWSGCWSARWGSIEGCKANDLGGGLPT